MQKSLTVYYYNGGNEKNLGQCHDGNGGQSTVGEPCDVATGNEYAQEIDYRSATLPLVRHYNSLSVINVGLGAGWMTPYNRRLELLGNTLRVRRADGRSEPFTQVGGAWQGDGDSALSVTQDGTGYTVVVENGDSERYDLTGKLHYVRSPSGKRWTWAYDPQSSLLTSVTDSFGNALTFQYGSNGMLQTVTLPGGSSVQYAYDGNLNLTSSTYPDSTVRKYLYENTANGAVNELTGIVDESGNRYATFSYNSSFQVTSSQHAGGADKVSLSYGYGSTAVTDALGTQRTYAYQAILNRKRTTAISGSTCLQCGGANAVSYDAHGNATSRTDFNGILTQFNYDTTRNLETSRTEAYGTPRARTITTQWDASWRLPDVITEPSRTTAFTYDSGSNLASKTISDTTVSPNASRTWSYTYDGYGRVLTATGPRTDVRSTTTYAYYTCTTGFQCGQLQTLTDAAGNITSFNTYNAHGQPLTITDPNGVVTTLTYDARQRLTSRQVGSETTSFAYYSSGMVQKVTLPDGSYAQYSYDAAHRLTAIADGAGNSIQYTLDAMGNRTAESTYDPGNKLHRTHARVFNAFDELYQDINAANTAAVTTSYGYDSNGNQTSIAAPLSRTTNQVYDELNRLKQITDPAGGRTYFSFDANDHLTSVQDPRGLTTTYAYNGFGDLTRQVSPDTGTTANSYDSGGNLSLSTDARGATAAYRYDALNRIGSIVYKNSAGVADQTLQFAYDTGTNGKGRLVSTSDANQALSWSYDGLGRVTGKTQSIGTVALSVGYAYTHGDLTSITTPSGQLVVYGYNGNHQVTSIMVNGATVLSAVTYEPFGGVSGWVWGSGDAVARTFNGDGLISQIVSASVTNGYSFDNANRISAVSDSSNGALSWSYGFDALDRLTSASTSALSYGWTYDADGNRLTQSGTAATTFNINASSNQLGSTTGALVRTYLYDAAGAVSAYGSDFFAYNNRARMTSATAGAMSTSYLYNALGQRIEKSNGSGGLLFAYDEAGHLLGEYDLSGHLIEETVWLGDIPVATLQPSGSNVSIYYLHTDQLNSPKKATRASDNGLMWRIDQDPFGTAAPNQNPAGLGTFSYNLRYPGQYYDSETGLNYNYFRDYDPQVGRYLESDPIGLYGGSYSTYLYAANAPILHSDRLGLVPPKVSGSGINDTLQDLPDSICAWWPAYCIKRLWVCLEARCKYTNCSGTWYITITQWVPSRPTPDEVAKETPNCVCTKTGLRHED